MKDEGFGIRHVRAIAPILLALIVFLTLGAVQVVLAPDQPIPHVYVDDPLVLELTSDADVAPSVQLEIQADGQSVPASVDLGKVQLRAQSARWIAIEDTPRERGRYRVRTHIQTGDTATESDGTFCRIDRPAENSMLPLSVAASQPSSQFLLAAKDIGLKTVVLDADLPDLAARIEEASSLGMQVAIALSTQTAAPENIAKQFTDRVVRWEIDCGASGDAFATVAKAVRQGGSKAPIGLVVADASSLTEFLKAGLGQFSNFIVLKKTRPERPDILTVRLAAERAGYEAPDLCLAPLLESNTSEDPAPGPRLVRETIDALGTGCTQIEAPSASVYGETFGAGYTYLSALNQQLAGRAFIGPVDGDPPARAYVFRSKDEWLLVVWNHEPGSKEWHIKVENATDCALRDPENNALPMPEVKDGVLTLSISDIPLFLTGKAGTVISQAAQTMIRRYALALTENEESKNKLPEELHDTVRTFVQAGPSSYTRLDFLNVLKLFPRIEEMWHSGSIARSVAVPALANLSRLARALCITEQDRGEPFIEPLQKTLEICGQFQSLYLTSSAGSSEARERPDWIMAEVTRLMDQAEALAAEGRAIEACGVGALAEWRARSLEAAAKAEPLSAPEKEPKPAETPPAPTPAKAKDSKEDSADAKKDTKAGKATSSGDKKQDTKRSTKSSSRQRSRKK